MTIQKPLLKMYYCEVCRQYFHDDDMVIYSKATYTGKCRECVKKLEAQRKMQQSN